jgi:hypothetical protein
VHWFAPSFSLRDRLRRVAREIHMDDFVKVAPLPPGLDYPPGVKANREPSGLVELGNPTVAQWPENGPRRRRQEHP